jgi:hypothetical protein
MWMFNNTRLVYWRLLHRCYLGVLSLSFSTHLRILFSTEYFHYKVFVISTSRGTPRKCSRYPRLPRNPGWESLPYVNKTESFLTSFSGTNIFSCGTRVASSEEFNLRAQASGLTCDHLALSDNNALGKIETRNLISIPLCYRVLVMTCANHSYILCDVSARLTTLFVTSRLSAALI